MLIAHLWQSLFAPLILTSRAAAEEAQLAEAPTFWANMPADEASRTLRLLISEDA